MKKQTRSRREFVSLAGSAVAGLAGGPWLERTASAQTQPPPSHPTDPDLVVVNAKVYTVDAARPRAEAFAVRGGRFLAVGTTDEMKALAGKSTHLFDARQMTIVPGFIDCHNHAPGN